MRTELRKILAVVMVLALAVSMFAIGVSANTDNGTVGDFIVATPDETTTDEVTTPDEPTVDEVTTPDETTTDEVTTPDEPTTDEIATPDVLIYGDVNLTGNVSISDATEIQKAVAELITLSELQATLADVDADGNITIKDATEIQKYIAELPVDGLTGTVLGEEATKDEVTTPDEATKDETTSDEATKDEVTTPDEATTDEATQDEETAFYLVGYINGADYGIEGDWDNLGENLFVDGTVTLTITADSYVIVKDADNVGYWTNGWLDMNPGSAVLGEFGANNNKLHVPAGEVTFTWDAATMTLSYVVA